jgi:RPAP1-like, N-terminal
MTPPPPLVGNVVERDSRASKRSSNSNGRRLVVPTTSSEPHPRPSRFAQRNHSTSTSLTGGFPSFDVPVGTFVRTSHGVGGGGRGNNNNVSAAGARKGGAKASGDDTTILASRMDDPSSSTIAPTAVNPSTTRRSRDLSSSSATDLKEASEKDAQAMLSNLSLEEIKQYQEEVQSALSPEMVSFLRSRGRGKAQAKATTINDGASPLGPDHRRTIPSTPHGNGNGSTSRPSDPLLQQSSLLEDHRYSVGNVDDDEKILERMEKERIANLVSSVKSHEDLDGAFRAEMGQSHPLELPRGEKVNHLDNSGHPVTRESFQVACDLLRSTCPRQALWAARTVSSKLEEMAKGSVQLSPSWSRSKAKATLPVVLSVSLRCLLDKPPTTTYLLHTYALQSLSYLTTIFAHRDHVVSMVPSADMNVDACIFQEYFLDDAVPVPPLNAAYPPMSIKPLTIDESGKEIGSETSGTTTTATPVAYATSSSTSSAVSDGRAFETDPMWTLLSKMKILPRLSFLVQSFEGMPVEAWVAVCGLLSMVAQRSPGAASAIVNHGTLISRLLNRAQRHTRDGGNSGSRTNEKTDGDILAYAAVRLFCILARQSRVAAQGLPLEDMLPPLLATKASSDVEFRSQQLGLVLWRTSLRYGLGLEALASMLTLSARHLALPYSNRYSLSTEFLSSFTQVLECVKVVRSKNPEDIASAKWHNQTVIDQTTLMTIHTATKYMASITWAILPRGSVTPSLREDENWILKYRWNAARLSYLTTLCQIFEQTVNVDDTVAMEEMPSEDVGSILSAVRTWAEADGDMERAWRLISRRTAAHANGEGNVNLELEAAACAFLQGCMSIALTIGRWNGPAISSSVHELRYSVVNEVTSTILRGLKATLDPPVSKTVDCESTRLAREGWINQCQFSVAKFWFHSVSTNVVASSSDVTLMRSMVFSLIGRLRRGDESIAANLFSSDMLFQLSGNPLQEESRSVGSSPISSMFLGELCGSDRARNQLDHSFKLHHGFGLTSAGFGPFTLDSLLSEADQPAMMSGASADDNDAILPLGELWLWKSLSGSIHMREQVVAAGTVATVEAIEVIAATLDLILEMDETEEVVGIACYSTCLPLGSRLYYLINVCLHPETVLSDERILDSGEAILDRYLRHFGDNEQDIFDFCLECSQHSTPTKGRSKRGGDAASDHEADAFDEADKKLLERLVNQDGATIAAHSGLPIQEIRAVENLLEDMSNAYREYGAQYDFFTKCIRMFLHPVFPTAIRCRALKELDGMLHLLTLPKESKDTKEQAKLLHKNVTGGLPGLDGSVRDGPDVLDAAARVLARGAESSRPLGRYMENYCVALLARGLGAALAEEGGPTETFKRRLDGLDECIVTSICKAASVWIGKGGTKDSLVDAVMDATSDMQRPDRELFLRRVADAGFVDDCVNRWAAVSE